VGGSPDDLLFPADEIHDGGSMTDSDATLPAGECNGTLRDADDEEDDEREEAELALANRGFEANPPPLDTHATRSRDGGAGRIDSLDLLRGLIVIVMAWDHSKDFLASYKGQDGTSPGDDGAGSYGTHTEGYAGPLEMFSGRLGYFLARAISHICAPGFSFLMGAGMIMLKESRMTRSGWTGRKVCRFFLLRGILLIVLGFVVRASFLILLVDPTPVVKAHISKSTSPVLGDLLGFFQVMTSLGLSMIAASPLVSMMLPRLTQNELPSSLEAPLLESSDHQERIGQLEAAASVRKIGVICGLLATAMLAADQCIVWLAQGSDPGKAHTTDATSFGEIIVRFTLVPGEFDTLPSQNEYPFVPWLAICLAGVSFGASLIVHKDRVIKSCGLYGACLLALFVLARLLGGRVLSMRGWPLHEGREYPAISILNVCKYPPSVAYMLLTMGINLLLLRFLAKVKRPGSDPCSRSLLAFGRAPLVFYVVHFYAITAFTVILYATTGIYGIPMSLVFVVWLGLLALMRVLCDCFAAFKKKTTVDSIWRFF